MEFKSINEDEKFENKYANYMNKFQHLKQVWDEIVSILFHSKIKIIISMLFVFFLFSELLKIEANMRRHPRRK